MPQLPPPQNGGKGTPFIRLFQGLCESVSHSVMSDFLRPLALQPTRLPCPWNSPGKNTGEGCHSLLQGIFPTQGPDPGLPHCRQILYSLSHQGLSGISHITHLPHYLTHSKHLNTSSHNHWDYFTVIGWNYFAVIGNGTTEPLGTMHKLRSSPSQTHWFQYVDFVTSILTAQRSFLVLLTSWISAVFQGDRWGLKTTAKEEVVLL